MASSRKPKRAERESSDLARQVRAALAGRVPPGSRIVVALSGGLDSVVLLDVLGRLASRCGWQLSAVHVNHQLQPGAADWARFCRRLCEAAGVPVRVVRVRVPSGPSVEAAARAARYAALLRGGDYVALAHHADDQAETVLLHLLRGAGIRGLGGMRTVAAAPAAFAAGRPRAPVLLRPLLDVPRAALEAHARRHGLAWIDDPSNTDVNYTRNFVRHAVAPVLAQRFPAYRQALARTAGHAAEALELLDDLARLDGAPEAGMAGLPVARLRALTVPRAKNLLRHFLQQHGIDLPSAERLDEAVRQARSVRHDARLSIVLGEQVLRLQRGELFVVRAAVPPAPSSMVVWAGESELALPQFGGVLRMERGAGAGLSLVRLGAAPVTIRPRQGGERLRPGAAARSRTVKNLLQEARVAPWWREHLPFIYCGTALVCLPGIATAAAFQAAPGEPSILPVWEPG